MLQNAIFLSDQGEKMEFVTMRSLCLSWVMWFKPVFLATGKAEPEGLQFLGQPGQHSKISCWKWLK
jgi:hypothetical protein